MNKKYYVYKFVDKDKNVLYVGRTTNILNRFRNHHALSDNVDKIYYTECASMADMVWKELYYIGYYYSDYLINTSDVCKDGVTELNLSDKWTEFIRCPNIINNKNKKRKNKKNNNITDSNSYDNISTKKYYGNLFYIKKIEEFKKNVNLSLINICDSKK